MKEIVNDGFAKVVKPYMDAQDKKSREIIAPVEVSPAEAPHSVGDQIIYNGLLYDVTAPIAINDALSTSGAGANISAADNIEAQIKATKSQIQAAAAQAADQNKNTQKMLAPVEEDETDASRAYVIGEQLILDGILYNVIDPIAQHGIITAEGAGANIEEADDVTTQLSSLNQTLTNKADTADVNTALATKADASALTLLDGKAYKTDDTTENTIADNDIIPFYDASAAAKRKTTVSKLFGQMVSNRNLLDNPFFTINQRGANTYDSTASGGGSKYTLDRWWSIFANVEVTEGGVILSSPSGQAYNGFLRQAITDEKALRGKKCTFSVDVAEISGTGSIQIIKSTGMNTGQISIATLDFTTTGIQTVTGTIPNDAESNEYPYLMVSIAAKKDDLSSLKIRSAKLEEGEHSTLALDAEPNYATELLKCQRYFYRVGSTEWIQNYLGIACSATDVRVPIKFPVEMYEKPSLSVNADSGIGVTPWGAGDVIVASAIDRGTKAKDSMVVTLTVTGATAKSPYFIYIPANSYIDFSADL